MNKLLLFVFLLNVGCMQAQSPSSEKIIDEIFDQYGDREEMNTLTLSGSFLKAFQNQEDTAGSGKNFPKQMQSFRMINTKEGSANPVDKQVYDRLISSLNREKWEPVVETRSKGEATTVFLRQGSGEKADAIVLSWNKDKFSLIALSGFFKMEDLENMTFEN